MNRITAIRLFSCFCACIVALCVVILMGVLPAAKTVEAQTPAPFLISPYYGTTTISQGYTTTHRAYDFLLRYVPVIAAESGTIKKVDWYSDDPLCHQNSTNAACGFGLYIRMQHPNGYWTIYGHLSTTGFDFTDAGTSSVSQGQFIGNSGHTGYSIGPHLHFEVRPSEFGNGVDPFNPSLWEDGQWASPSHPLPTPVNGGEVIVHEATGWFTRGSGGPFNNPCPQYSLDCGGWMWDGSDTYIRYWAIADGNTTPDQWAKWQAQGLPASGSIYEVYVHVPSTTRSRTWQARYILQNNSGSTLATGVVDQAGLPDPNYSQSEWVSLGAYSIANGYYLYTTDATGEAYAQHCAGWCVLMVDAVKFVSVDGIYYDDTSGSVTYNGTWTLSSGWPTRAYNATVTWSNSVGSSASLTFSGSQITRLYTMAFNRGYSTVYIDGISQGTFYDYAPTTRWQVAKTWSVSPGTHTIRVQVPGGSGGYVDLDAFVVDDNLYVGSGAYDDPHSQFKYLGNWTHSASFPSAYNGTVSYSNASEDAVTFTFTGSQVAYKYTKAYNRGKAAITIDGVDKGYVDLYSSTIQWQQGTTFANLGSGIHTIHISVSGQKNPSATDYYVDVDALIVQ